MSKIVTNGTTITITDYLTGFQYTNAVLQFFPHTEGYVNVRTGPAYNYVFNYTDHLGNVRVSYAKDAVTNVLRIMEENHYYAFGLKHTNYNTDVFEIAELGIIKTKVNTLTNAGYKYKYNGKELQDELGLNVYAYGWRDYDPAIGRFLKIDRFAEKYNPISPYSYTANNPLKFIDIKGDSLYVAQNGKTKEYLNDIVKDDNKKFIKYNKNGSVTLDFNKMSPEEISEAIKNDEGLSLISALSTAIDKDGKSENYYFEASNNREGVYEGKEFSFILDNKSGDVVSNNSPASSFSIVPRGDGYPDILPKKGFQAATYISPGQFYDRNPFMGGSIEVPMSGVVKHELKEIYIRTHEKKPYKEAHESAGSQKRITKFKFD